MSLRLKYPYHKQPRGGWHLPVDGFVIHAIGPDELIEKVRQHLLANNKPPRDIEGDLIAYCAEKYPHLVEEDWNSTRAIPPVDPLEKVMINNLFLSRRPLDEPPTKDEVRRRKEICAKCPFMAQMTGKLLPEVDRVSFLLTRGNLEPLGRCTKHCWDCRVAVQWDAAALDMIKEQSVSGCWI